MKFFTCGGKNEIFLFACGVKKLNFLFACGVKKLNFLFACGEKVKFSVCGEKVASGSCATPGYTNSVSSLTLHPKSGSHSQQSSVIISFLHPNPRESATSG